MIDARRAYAFPATPGAGERSEEETAFLLRAAESPRDKVALVEDLTTLSPRSACRSTLWRYIAVAFGCLLVRAPALKASAEAHTSQTALLLASSLRMTPSASSSARPLPFARLANAVVQSLTTTPETAWQALVADPTTLPDFTDVLLILNFNGGANLYGYIPRLLELYGPFFPNVRGCRRYKKELSGAAQVAIYGADSFTAPDGSYSVTGVDQRLEGLPQAGAASYRSFLAAYRDHPSYMGYLFTNDVRSFPAWSYRRHKPKHRTSV